MFGRRESGCDYKGIAERELYGNRLVVYLDWSGGYINIHKYTQLLYQCQVPGFNIALLL